MKVWDGKHESHVQCVSLTYNACLGPIASSALGEGLTLLACSPVWAESAVLLRLLSIDNANFILWAHAHQYWYSHNCMVCWLSTKENVHYDQVLPPVLLHGCGSQARFGVLCIYMECSTYIWSTPYINIWTYTIVYVCSTAFVHRALHIYVDHGLYGTLHI